MSRFALMVTVGMSLSLIATPAFAQVCDICDPKGKCYEPDKCEPPPKKGADCSPGYYKNHISAWCDPGDTQPTVDTIACGGIIGTVTCQDLVDDWLDASQGNPVSEREAAKACLDAMFGSAEASPCEDD